MSEGMERSVVAVLLRDGSVMRGGLVRHKEMRENSIIINRVEILIYPG